MSGPLIKIDDKHVPIFRVVWVADLPHFCGVDECPHEGYYEVRLEAEESLWINLQARDGVLETLNHYYADPDDRDEGHSW